MSSQIETCDVLIVGARCAGAATAILLARAGFEVRMIDRAPEIGDTLSTHALMRPGVAMLDRLGVLPAIMKDTPAVTRTRFFYGPEVVDLPVGPVGSAKGLCAPRRFLLDRTLCDAAVAAGVRLSLGTSFEGVIRDGSGRVIGAELRRPDGSRQRVHAELVIGADGRNSRVAEAVGARVLQTNDNRAATVFGYFPGIPNEGYRWFFGKGVQAGVIPTTADMHCVFTSCRPAEFQQRFQGELLAAMARELSAWTPEVARSILSTGPEDRLRRYPGAPGIIRDCTGPGWALVGDAGYFKDPATAHGITDALLDAGRLAEAWTAAPGDLSAYRKRRDAHTQSLFAITHRIASFDWDYAELGVLHRDLNDAMKAEHADMFTAGTAREMAA